jgi:lipopolysaccharide transport protein LptA
MKKTIIPVLICFLLLSASIVYSQNTKAPALPKSDKNTNTVGLDLKKGQPFVIRHADRMNWNNQKNKTIGLLSGKVELYLEKDKITISADSVWYQTEPTQYTGIGNVKITKIDLDGKKITALAHIGKFTPDNNRIVLEGNPKVFQNKDELYGNPLILTFTDQGSTVEGENIHGTFFPSETPEKDKKNVK